MGHTAPVTEECTGPWAWLLWVLRQGAFPSWSREALDWGWPVLGFIWQAPHLGQCPLCEGDRPTHALSSEVALWSSVFPQGLP